MYYIHSGYTNTKIAVEDLNPSSSKVVLFIHGWPLNHKIFEYQTNMLPQLGFRTVSVDLRGFGQSDVTAEGYDYNQMAKDIYKVVESLRLGNFTLVGYSMGGAIAVRYMTLFKGYRVRKLGLLAAAVPLFTQRSDYPYGMTKEQVDELIAQTYRDRPQMAAEFGENLFASKPTQNLRDWFKDISWSASGIGTIGTAVALRDEDLRTELKMIKVPTGIFHGKLDKVCPYEFANIMHEGIMGSQLYTFENSGHAIFYDELEKFNEYFISFLK